jgi:hypothetical protein
MPQLVRFLIRHGLIGLMIGVGFTALVLVLDVGAIRSMTAGTVEGLGVRLLLAFFICSTFASAQMGIAVMWPPSQNDDPMAPPDEDRSE